MIDLSNRVCLITGAGHGIGRGVAEGFVKRGALVVATSRKTPDVAGAAMNLAWDVGDLSQAKSVVDQVIAQFGRIDCFVANAGIYPRVPWTDITHEDWRHVQGVNVDGMWAGAQEVARHMVTRGYGKIVLVTSVEPYMGTGAHIHYTTSKSAALGMTTALSRALGPKGIRVNALMPGAVRTETELQQFPDQERVAKVLAERQCLPSRLEPAGIEPAFAFLCSSESDAITGQVLCVDHGLIHY